MVANATGDGPISSFLPSRPRLIPFVADRRARSSVIEAWATMVQDLGNAGLWSRPSHMQVRSQCIRKFEQIFGHNPLKYTTTFVSSCSRPTFLANLVVCWSQPLPSTIQDDGRSSSPTLLRFRFTQLTSRFSRSRAYTTIPSRTPFPSTIRATRHCTTRRACAPSSWRRSIGTRQEAGRRFRQFDIHSLQASLLRGCQASM